MKILTQAIYPAYFALMFWILNPAKKKNNNN